MPKSFSVQVARFRAPGEAFDTPIIHLACPTPESVSAIAQLFHLYHSGEETIKSPTNPVHVGDTQIKVTITEHPTDPERVLVELALKRSPRDLTYVFYQLSEQDRLAASLFRLNHEFTRSYVFCLSHNNELLFDHLYLVKYLVDYAFKPVEIGPR
ncbi:MAG: hypothetical protein AB1331_06195 [Bacillota bacterium]